MVNRLHNQNRTHTHIDVEKGEFISLPKDGTDYPPVNADINNLITYGKTTGGEGTHDNPIPLINVSEWNKTVCKTNLWDSVAMFDAYDAVETTNFEYVDVSGVSAGRYFTPNTTARGLQFKYGFKTNTQYRLKLKFFFSGTQAGTFFRVYYTDGTNMSLYTTTYQQWVTVNMLSAVGKTIDYIAILYASNVQTYFDVNSFMITKGTADISYEAYNGNTYPYRLEDADGVLHNIGDLPDGTKDSYDRDNNLFAQKVKVNTFLNATEWKYYSYNDTIAFVHFADVSNTWGVYAGTSINAICTIAKPSLVRAAGNFYVEKIDTYTQITLLVLKSEITSILKPDGITYYGLDNEGAQAWITAHCPFTVMYELATPQTFQIKPYSAEFPYNEKPSSIQYHTNIFNDAGLEMQCEVRKLGNRAIGTFNFTTENGDKIITEDGDYIMLEY